MKKVNKNIIKIILSVIVIILIATLAVAGYKINENKKNQANVANKESSTNQTKVDPNLSYELKNDKASIKIVYNKETKKTLSFSGKVQGINGCSQTPVYGMSQQGDNFEISIEVKTVNNPEVVCTQNVPQFDLNGELTLVEPLTTDQETRFSQNLFSLKTGYVE